MHTVPLTGNALMEDIDALRKERNAIILAHYYQEPAIQDIADHVGDSLELARWAADADADVIVFSGVRFMAETAKVLNPSKTVLLPDLDAGCSLSDSCDPEAFRAFTEAHPNHRVVTYINCSVEVKALSDIICTSSNAEAIIRSIPPDVPIIFAPDRNLGRYLIQRTGRDMVLWDGSCMVHEAFSIDKLLELARQHPDARIIAHPESDKAVLRAAAFIGSTAAMIRHVKEHPANTFIIATEAGILHRMQQQVPEKTLIPAPSHEDNTCACSECAFMKMNTLEKLYLCLRDMHPRIEIEEGLRQRALAPLLECLHHRPAP